MIREQTIATARLAVVGDSKDAADQNYR